MDLSTAEKFLLLIHHPTKARYVVPEQKRNAGVIGGIMLDLAMEEKIKVVDKRVKVLSHSTRISTAHNMILKKMSESKKQKKVRSWLSSFVNLNAKYRHPLLEDMRRKRLIQVEKKRFLFIPYKQSRLMDKKKQATLASEIREAILQKKPVDSEMSAILGLIEATRIYKIISKDREELKVIKASLREMIKEDIISSEVSKVLREMQAAVASSVAVTSAATS